MSQSDTKQVFKGSIFALHLAALYSFGVVQPIYNLLEAEPHIFVAFRFNTQEFLTLVLAVSVLVPLVIFAVFQRLRIQSISEAVFFLFSMALFEVYALRLSTFWNELALVLAFIAAWIFLRLYRHVAVVRRFMTFLSASLVATPALFLLHPHMREFLSSNDFTPLSDGQVSRSELPPIVMVVFDELPLVSLLKTPTQIDAEHFPNFAALANDANWFTNASTLSGTTYFAVPSLLSGMRPNKSKALPWFVDHPQNLFTLLSKAYELNVFEQLTFLCPESLCKRPDSVQATSFERLFAPMYLGIRSFFSSNTMLLVMDPASYLKRAGQRLRGEQVSLLGERLDIGGFASEGPWLDDLRLFTAFLNSLKRSAAPRLNFLHITLPHYTYRFMPDGLKYWRGADSSNFIDNVEFNDQQEWQAALYYQRHLLQTQYLDSLLGRLLERMKSEGLYSKSIVIVTADHGNAFQAGHLHRVASNGAASEVLGIPLFIKWNEQTQGDQDNRNVSNIDILPTLIARLGLETSRPFEGLNVLSKEFHELPDKLFYEIDGPKFEEQHYDAQLDYVPAIERKAKLFPAGNFLALGGCEALYGNSIKDLDLKPVAGNIQGYPAFRNIHLNDSFLPLYVNGTVSLKDAAQSRLQVIIGLNGKVSGFSLVQLQGTEGEFMSMLRREAFQEGSNIIELFRTGDNFPCKLVTY